jgi:hypothetical protein
MAEYVIRSEGYAQLIPGGADGQYLEWYDPRADGPGGDEMGGDEMGGWTPDLDKAMKFPAAPVAWAKWNEPMIDKQNRPRHDMITGRTERPLTAFNITVLTVEQAREEAAKNVNKETT